MSENTNVSFEDFTGQRHEISIDVTDYRAAADNKLSLSQHYSRKYPTRQDQPTALEQMAESAGIRLRADVARGIPASNMHEIMHGSVDKSMGTLVRPDGSDRHTVAGRLLFPEILMQTIQNSLIDNKEDYLTPWESAIALKTSVTGPRVDQPRIEVTAPMNSAAQPISQLAEAATMVSITLSDKTYTIPTKAIGLQVADQALQATTIDLVGLALTNQARGERIRRIEEDMANIIAGDVDFGIAATTFANASTFDALVTGGVVLTHKAYVKWLRANYQKMQVSHILCDIDSALAVDGRTNRPQAFNDSSTQANRVNVEYSIENLGLPAPKLLLLPTSIVGANRLIGFDSRYALHEITNVSASYSAIENFVLRRSTGMRFDFGIALVKLYDEAFTGLTMAA